VVPRSIAPRFIANLTYHQNSPLSRFPPIKIPRYAAKLGYRHRFSDTYNFYSGLKVMTRKVNTGNYSNQNNSPVPTLNYEINDRVQ
jgi:hypothetical protein